MRPSTHARTLQKTIPPFVAKTLTAMRAERTPIAARLDAIDLAIANVERIWEPSAEAAPAVQKKRPYVKRAAQKPAPVAKADAAESGPAGERRTTLLTLIVKSEVGLTLGELRKLTPKMDGKDRSNALQQLKATGEIRRAGNTWEKGKA